MKIGQSKLVVTTTTSSALDGRKEGTTRRVIGVKIGLSKLVVTIITSSALNGRKEERKDGRLAESSE